MQRVFLLVAITITLLTFAGSSAADPIYIYSMHDPGGEGHMADMGTKGWIVFTEEIGHDPNNYSGRDYTSWSNQGYGVIVRLNNGYGYNGTIPYDSQYDNFAQRCANYIAASPGGQYWIIGNETNLPREWPGNIDGDPNTGQPITVSRYVSCYNKCYTKIKAAVPGAKLIPAAVGTWAPPYWAQGIEEFDTYYINLLNGIGASKIDGIAIHAYTHGCDPNLVFSEQKMGPPYEDIYYHFRVYKNYMWKMPSTMTTKPVFITECDENVECASGGYTWYNANTGWVRNAYYEINQWNQNNSQKIRCLTLFRWPDVWEGQWNFGIAPRQGVIDDWRQAMSYQYKWTTTPPPPTQNDAGSGGDAGNTFGTALGINPGSYTGYLERNVDNDDYYKFGVTSGQVISVSMTPPSNADFDIYLYNPAGAQKAQSELGTGQTDSLSFTADSSGDWRLRVYAYSGSGTYSFSVSVTSPTTGTNLALNAPTSLLCGYYNTSSKAKYAKDGSLGTKWCCAHNGMYNGGDHWLAYDLGSNCTVTGYKVKHASTAGEPTYYNTKTFYIESASSLQGPWTQEFYVNNTNQESQNTLNYSTPKTLRYVRIRVTKPNYDADWAVRIPEFEVWGTAGTEAAIKLEAEDYDGGFGALNNQDYYDTDSGNSGGAYRSQNVDIETCSEGGWNVGWIYSNEWLLYPWKAKGTTYSLAIRYAGTSNGTCRLLVDGVDKTGAISLPATGGWQSWATKSAGTITVTPGEHDVKLRMDSTGFNVNYFTLTPGSGGGGGNLLTNGDFESGFTNGVPNGWTTWTSSWSNPITYMDEVNTVHGGSHSARWGRMDNLRLHGGLCQAVSVSPGQSYDLSGWLRWTSSDPNSWLEFGYDLTGQTSNGEASTITYTKLESGGQNTWLPYSNTVTATGSTMSIFLKFGHYDEVGGGYCWAVADDISVTQH